MKCTQCGCTKMIKVGIPFYVNGDAHLEMNNTLSTYACTECGHLEWFDTSISDTFKSKLLHLENSTDELNKLKKQLENLDDPNVITKLECDCKIIEKELKSLDITIRHKQQLETKLRDLQTTVREHHEEKAVLEQKITNLERAVANLKKEIDDAIIFVK